MTRLGLHRVRRGHTAHTERCGNRDQPIDDDLLEHCVQPPKLSVPMLSARWAVPGATHAAVTPDGSIRRSPEPLQRDVWLVAATGTGSRTAGHPVASRFLCPAVRPPSPRCRSFTPLFTGSRLCAYLGRDPGELAGIPLPQGPASSPGHGLQCAIEGHHLDDRAGYTHSVERCFASDSGGNHHVGVDGRLTLARPLGATSGLRVCEAQLHRQPERSKNGPPRRCGGPFCRLSELSRTSLRWCTCSTNRQPHC